jgi:bacteriophage repressor protein C1|nr:MAG TPA: putative transcriptional regulator [Caudoviricetes sp.]
MKYDTVWSAVDNLAKSLGMSPSGLAKKSGLDSTTFNRSKRKRPDGKNRWPSLDSLNKVFEFCNITFEEFYKYGETDNPPENLNTIPYIKLSGVSKREYCQDGEICTANWETICFPDGTKNLYAMEIDNTDYAPLYKFGTTLILAKHSEIRRNDRVAVFKKDGAFLLAEFIRRKPRTLELQNLNAPEESFSENIDDILFLSRIVWASQ